MTIRPGASSKEDLRRFRERVERGQDEGRRQLALQSMLPRERRFAADLSRFFVQARWIMIVRQFPDGRPLLEQTEWHLAMWRIFIEAIEARMAGAGQQ